MDFEKIKQKALQLKDQAVQFWNETLDKTALKLAQSNLVLKNESDFKDFKEKSKNKTYETSEWETKTFIKRCIVIVWDSKKDFFKEILFTLPVLLAKTFSQNMEIKMIDIAQNTISLENYNLQEIPSMLVFENNELYKIISGEEGIKTVVKNLSLDINKTIDEI